LGRYCTFGPALPPHIRHNEILLAKDPVGIYWDELNLPAGLMSIGAIKQLHDKSREPPPPLPQTPNLRSILNCNGITCFSSTAPTQGISRIVVCIEKLEDGTEHCTGMMMHYDGRNPPSALGRWFCDASHTFKNYLGPLTEMTVGFRCTRLPYRYVDSITFESKDSLSQGGMRFKFDARVVSIATLL
jgi:hypothetical protein